jgi:hypothetical protein
VSVALLDGQLDRQDEELLLAADRLRDATAERWRRHKIFEAAEKAYEEARTEDSKAYDAYRAAKHAFGLVIERQAIAQATSSAPADTSRGITLRPEPAAPAYEPVVDVDVEIPF